MVGAGSEVGALVSYSAAYMMRRQVVWSEDSSMCIQWMPGQ
jgi:hypothetical protein